MSKVKPVYNAVPMPPIHEIMERVRVGKADEQEIIHLGNIMEAFKFTEAYELLKLNTTQTQQAMLSLCRSREKEEANHELGFLEGMQNVIDMRDNIIKRAVGVLGRKSKETDLQLSEEETLAPRKKHRKLGPDEI